VAPTGQTVPMARRVVVWGSGNVGRPAIRAVATHRDLELAGVVVHDPAKVGVDAGDLAGIGPLGLAATDDVDVAHDPDTDVVVYAVNADFRPVECLEEALGVLAAGANVVSTAFHPLLHPPSAPTGLRSRVEAACAEGDTSIFVSGIDPGWVMDVLPLFLTGMAAGVDEIRIQELANYGGYHQPRALRDLCGFGNPMDYRVPMLDDAALHMVWAPMLRVLADGLGVELDDVSTSTDRRPLERTLSIDGIGEFEAGTQGAFRFEVTGHIAGQPLLVLEHVTRIDDECAPDWPQPDPGGGFHRVVMSGHPRLTVSVHGEDPVEPGAANGGNAVAANRIVNAIPAVCEAPPGPVHPLDLSTVVAAGQVRWS